MSWEHLLPYTRYLPNFKKIVLQGLKFIIKAIPPLTPPSWNNIFTGCKLQKHGIRSFIKVNSDGSYCYITSLDVKVPRLNEILATNSLNTVTINYPFSYPIHGWYLKNHILVYDAFLPREFIYPQELKPLLKYFKQK